MTIPQWLYHKTRSTVKVLGKGRRQANNISKGRTVNLRLNNSFLHLNGRHICSLIFKRNLSSLTLSRSLSLTITKDRTRINLTNFTKTISSTARGNRTGQHNRILRPLNRNQNGLGRVRLNSSTTQTKSGIRLTQTRSRMFGRLTTRLSLFSQQNKRQSTGHVSSTFNR